MKAKPRHMFVPPAVTDCYFIDPNISASCLLPLAYGTDLARFRLMFLKDILMTAEQIFLHLHEIVKRLYFHFSLSVYVCVCVSVCLSVRL